MKRALRYLRPAVAIVASLASLAACTQNGGAIFATIQQEEKTISTLLPKTIAVQNVLELEVPLAVPAADGRVSQTCVVAVAETPYVGVQKSPPSNALFDWTSLAAALPLGATAMRSAVALGGKVYAVAAAGDATSLYSATPDAGLAAAPPTLAWIAAAPAGLTADQIPESLLLVNGELFLATRDTNLALGHRLYCLGADAATAVDTTVRSSTPVTAGAWDGTAYWFVAGVQLFAGTATDAIASPTDTTVPTSSSHAAYGGILAVGDTLYVSTRGGELFVRSAGVWSSTGALTYPGDSSVLAFSGLGSVGATVYVGSEGRGFFDLTTAGLPTAATLPAARMPDRTISEIYGGVVTRIVGLTGAAFVCTAGAGLWHKEIPADPAAFDPMTGWVWD